MQSVILLTLVASLVSCQTAVYQKVLVSNPEAVCLDGSPGAYYIHRGTDPTRIMLFFEGGGWCGAGDLASTTESCYQRSKGALGSSLSYPPTVSFSQGLLSDNPQN